MNEKGQYLTVAIDGPAGSGKSTLGKMLARRLAYLYIDSGVMYRAVAHVALSRGIDINDETLITSLTDTLDIAILPPSVDDGRDHDLLADGEDITWRIRTPAVDACVSIVAAYPGVRSALTTRLRSLGASGRIVMVGRDIGTVVLPKANIKIYLDASAEERARRRFQEREQRGEIPDYQEILASIRNRDEIDSSRETAPLKPANDAVRINSDALTIEAVMDSAIELVKATARSQIA